MQMLTAADLNPPEDISDFIAAFWEQIRSVGEEEESPVKTPARMKAFAEDRVVGVLGHLEEIDGILVPLLDNWDLYRLGTVERVVLRLGVWEMKYGEVPAPVAINEAVDIANWFSSAKTRAIVNGVLDKYAKVR